MLKTYTSKTCIGVQAQMRFMHNRNQNTRSTNFCTSRVPFVFVCTICEQKQLQKKDLNKSAHKSPVQCFKNIHLMTANKIPFFTTSLLPLISVPKSLTTRLQIGWLYLEDSYFSLMSEHRGYLQQCSVTTRTASKYPTMHGQSKLSKRKHK